MGDAAAVASDLRQISDVVAKTTTLAQVLTDEVVAAAARRGIAQDLLGDRVAGPALRLVLKAITTQHADSLLSVLIELGDVAHQFSDLGWLEFEAQEQLFGRLGARKLAAGYATCVFEDLGSVSDLEKTEEEPLLGRGGRPEQPPGCVRRCRTRAARLQTGVDSFRRCSTAGWVQSLSGSRARRSTGARVTQRGPSSGWPSARRRHEAGGLRGSRPLGASTMQNAPR